MAVAVDGQREPAAAELAGTRWTVLAFVAAFLPMVPALSTASAGRLSGFARAGSAGARGTRAGYSAAASRAAAIFAAPAAVAAISINAPRPAPSVAGRAGGNSR